MREKKKRGKLQKTKKRIVNVATMPHQQNGNLTRHQMIIDTLSNRDVAFYYVTIESYRKQKKIKGGVDAKITKISSQLIT